MEEKVSGTRDFLVAILAAFLAALSQWGYDSLKELTGENRLFSAGGVFVIAFILLVVGDATVRLTLSHSRWLRRVIYGARYIEGAWFNVAYAPDLKVIREISIITISFDSGLLTADGIIHNDAGQRIGTWHTQYSSYDGKVFDYAYRRGVRHGVRESGEGRGQYTFAKERPFPLSFEGSFWDSSLGASIELFGLRVVEPGYLELIESSDMEQMRDFVRAMAKEFRSRRPELF